MSIYESKMRCLCSLVDLFQGTTALLDQTLRIGPGWGTGSGVAVHRCSSPDQSGLVVSYVSNVSMSCSLFFLNFHPWYGGWSSTAEIVEFWVPTTSWCPSAFSGVRWFNSKNEHHELCRLIATPFISIYVKFEHVGFHGQPTCFPAKLRRGHGLARQQLSWLEAALKILELRRTYRWCDGPTQWAKTWDAKLLSCGDTGYVVGSCQDFMAEEQLSTRFWWTWICLSKVLSNNINACNRAILEQHKFDFGSCSLRFVRITYVANSSFYSLQEHATA